MRISLTVAGIACSAFVMRAGAQDTLATVSRAIYGDMAVIVQVRSNQVRVAVDNGTNNLFLSFVGTDVRRWSDSTLRMLSRRRRRGDSSTWRSAINEPGMRSGTASLSILPDSGGPSYSLFFADDSLRTARGRVSSADALAFTRILRDAARMALGGRTAGSPGPQSGSQNPSRKRKA